MGLYYSIASRLDVGILIGWGKIDFKKFKCDRVLSLFPLVSTFKYLKFRVVGKKKRTLRLGHKFVPFPLSDLLCVSLEFSPLKLLVW